MDHVIYNPIGIIHSPYKEIEGMPIQPCGATGVRGSVEIKHEYVHGLKDIDGFSHIFLVYHFHIEVNLVEKKDQIGIITLNRPQSIPRLFQ